MTGVQVYMLRTDGQDVMIAATGIRDAIEADYRRFVDELDPDDSEHDSDLLLDEVQCRRQYDALLEQVVHVGEIEVFSGSAVAQLLDFKGGER